ncbi:M50 family metallopeptidase [Staphylococcus caprae]|uniref:M50 family metallopeptidase n=1 Tax=Staphylococcus caprae TaxID=29380 RepID=UPI0014520A1F|nr:M50 family metallopeptidase [Staphylococcus caprae]QJE26700.1 M50 family metallopeptidase [Staphylococcus caprae]
MNNLENILKLTIPFHLYWVAIIAIIYIIIHKYREYKVTRVLDIYLNYIPVLTHEIGHIIFNRLGGGKADDLVIVVSPKERMETSQQGFAVTRSKSRLGQIITTLGGYVMPPMMLYVGIFTIQNQSPSLFIIAYLVIFVYYLFITSRKLIPLAVASLLTISLVLLFKHDTPVMMNMILNIAHHFILGVLLGEVIQSSVTIAKLTLSKDAPTWDGSVLKSLTHLPTFIFSVIWIVINIYTVWQLFE